MKIELVVSLAVAVSFFTACGPGFGQASSTVGASGGSVSLGSALTVTLPPGAVSDDTLISVREVEPRHGEREFEIEPRGLVLKVTGEVSVESECLAELAEIENEVEHGVLTTKLENHRMRGELQRLGTLAVRRCDDSPDAGDDHGSGGNGADDALDAGDDHGGQGGHGNGNDDAAGHR